MTLISGLFRVGSSEQVAPGCKHCPGREWCVVCGYAMDEEPELLLTDLDEHNEEEHGKTSF